MRKREGEADRKAKENLILPSNGLFSKRQRDFIVENKHSHVWSGIFVREKERVEGDSAF